jgi:putative thioredoxin
MVKMASSDQAVDVGRNNFDEVVLRGSATRPVVVDFWAPWCGPCKMLGPILDKLAVEFAGRFTLAKLNTDNEPELAARYGIRGIPNVKAFVGGKVVDEFTGVLPESGVRQFLAAVVPSPAAPLVAEAKALLAGNDAEGALAKLDAAGLLDPANEAAMFARVEALLALERREAAAAIVAELEAPPYAAARNAMDERRLAALKARLALGGSATGDLQTLAAAAVRAPGDCAARLAYADALAAAGDYERALQELLAIVATDRAFRDDVGRRRMLTIFDALGPDSDLARRYRRELAAALNR